MKSAWMLMATVAAGIALMSAGCLQSDMGIARPAGANMFQDSTATPASKPANDLADAGGEAGNDTQVSALTERIEALAHTPAPAAPAPQSAAPAPAPVAVVRESPSPVVSTPAAATPVPAGTEAVADATMPRPTPIVAAVEPAANSVADTKPNTVNSETQQPVLPNTPDRAVVASPTPPVTPVVQAAPAPAAPVASANVSVEITDVRPVIATMPPIPAADTANQPSKTASDSAEPVDLKTLVAQYEHVTQQQPPNPEDEFRLRLLYLAAGMDEKSISPVKGMDPIQAEMLTAIVKTVASARQAMSKPLDPNPAALAAADDLRRLIGQQSGVSIPRVAMVTKVTSFGDYDSINPLRFKAGNEIHAYVYTEVANFRSEPVEGDRLRTLLSERVQVFDAAGKVVWDRNESKIEDRVRTPRRDFFVPFPVHLPANLPQGDYVLKVTVEDQLGGTTDQQRLSFSIQ